MKLHISLSALIKCQTQLGHAMHDGWLSSLFFKRAHNLPRETLLYLTIRTVKLNPSGCGNLSQLFPVLVFVAMESSSLSLSLYGPEPGYCFSWQDVS